MDRLKRAPSLLIVLLIGLLTVLSAGCGDGGACPTNFTDCGGTCADTASDVANCGACGNACAAGQVCSDAQCALSCQSGLTDCSGSCVDTQSSVAHCGACDAPCDAGEVCSAGQCALSCQNGLTSCNGSCVDLQSNLDHCGACDAPCEAGEVCSGGQCALSCQVGLTNCSGTCVDLESSTTNCGACDMACAAGEVCSGGQCALSCQNGLTDCNGTCVDLQSSNANCGACDMACAAGEVCTGGQCTLSCQVGLTDCNGACTKLDIDPANCGACGNVCAQDEACKGGSCLSTTPVTLQFLSISDWHGQLDPLTLGGVSYGGASVLSAYFKLERAANPNTLTFTAGDSFGAAPALSSFFDELPAVLAMNLMGLDADTFGNHNFDKGLTHLQSMIDAAEFDYVSSNLMNLNGNLTGVVAPYAIYDVAGVKVAVIGITSPNAPDAVFPGAFGGVTIADPVMSAMMARDAAAGEGAQIFIALIHEGATLYNPTNGTYSGPLIDFANGLSGFHVVFGDHTNIQVDVTVNGAHVVENLSKGRTYARVEMTMVPYSGNILSSSVTFVDPIGSAVTPDPAVEAMLAPYRAQLTALLDGVIGIATDVFPRGNNIERLEEVALGNLITDSMIAKYGTQLAITNGGGIRAPLPSSYLPADTMLRRTTAGYAAGPPYDLVGGDSLTVLPFGNAVVTRMVTGAQLWEALENGVSFIPAASGRFAQVGGFKFVYSAGAPVGSRVQSVTMNDGTPILPDQAMYSLALNDFMNAGGDGYSMFADGQGTTLGVMADVLTEYIQSTTPITPTIEGRITQVP